MAQGPFSFNSPGNIDPAVVGGLKVATWFVKEGFLGMNYPDWIKDLGFYLDFSYHRLNFSQVTGIWRNPTVPESFLDTFSSKGNAVTLAFMFAARYGFFPDSEVPFGRSLTLPWARLSSSPPNNRLFPMLPARRLILSRRLPHPAQPQLWRWKPASGGWPCKTFPWMPPLSIGMPIPASAIPRFPTLLEVCKTSTSAPLIIYSAFSWARRTISNPLSIVTLGGLRAAF